MGANSSNTTAAQAQKDLGLAVLQDTYAALDHGELQGHEERLREAANHLWEAYCMGAKEPAVVWSLKQLWTDTGHLNQVINLLKDYIKVSDDAEERFLAGHYVVDTYALMEADELAVEHHRRYMAELGPAVPAWRRLWTFADSTMMNCWQRSGQIDDWLSLSLPLYKSVQVNDESRLAVAYYLRTLTGIRKNQGRLHEAISCAERILDLYRGDDSPDALLLKGESLCALNSLYKKMGDVEQQERTMNEVLELLEQMEAARKRVIACGNAEGHKLAELYQRNAANFCHSIAFKLIWSGRPEESIAFFERALSYRENPITRFFYAGILMEVHGDREAALANLRKAASDPRSSLVHRFEEAFLENSSFASVHKDPEFLAVVRKGAVRYKTVGNL
ncbi:hypothetical protein FJZ31_36640 [Candidatus Poribacteria bacterium]|nr:hypothetical protein [Candidatus Poribacteria bacterium]